MEVDPVAISQGQTLRVSLKGSRPWSRISCRFDGRNYSFYSTENNTRRVLLPVPLESEPRTTSLEVKESGYLRWRRESFPVRISPGTFSKRKIRLPPAKMALFSDSQIPQAREKMMQALSTLTASQLWQGTFDIPVEGQMTSPFGGLRQISRDAPWRHHLGVDFGTPKNSEVRAANYGKVVLAERLPLQGGIILLNHGQGVVSGYLHLAKILVREGDFVQKGQKIGLTGSEGLSTAPHLHWGLYLWETPVDPMEWTHREF
ncbi:MAG: M23 family metallopeptidase [Elusimicrobia bacterium]|nr:M23 family metallopeptidase [Elusimicrobiota bacterium]